MVALLAVLGLLPVGLALSRSGPADWRRPALLHAAGVTTLAALAGTLGWLLLHLRRRRHAAELAASAADASYGLLAENMSEMILRVRQDGVRVYVSPACLTLLGYTQQEMLGRPFGADMHPDDAARQLKLWSPTIGTPARTTWTVRMRRRDGSYVWVEATSIALPCSPGAMPENVVVVRDITERHLAAAQLALANRRLLRAEEFAHIGHWRLELPSGALVASAGAFRIHGWRPDYVPTMQTAIENYHPDDRADVLAAVHRSIQTGQPFRFEKRVLRADGSIRHVIGHGEPEYGASGTVVALLGILQDITETREMEARLHQGQKLEAIGQLAAGVAHDFNNILQGVLGSLELILEDTSPGTDIHACAEIAANSGRRGAALTHQLLSYARKQILVPRPVNVAVFLADFRELLTRTLKPTIAVQVGAAAGTPDILVDPEHLQTALLNLAINAGQAMQGGGSLRIEASREPRAGCAEGWVVLAVHDTGSGMDAETLAKAAEPFFTTKGPGGTGLGLPMVLGFARQSGGDLRLTSTPGQGTTAEIVLPGHPAAAVPAPAPAAPARRGAGRVLLVDDVADVIDSTTRILSKAGFQVTATTSGDAALAVLAAGERFDALVTDYAMPGLSGVDLVTLAREMRPGLPAVIMTGFAEVDTDRIAHVATVLRKPFQRGQLVDAVLDLVMASPVA
jgi:PAS domain S-box-containing protein